MWPPFPNLPNLPTIYTSNGVRQLCTTTIDYTPTTPSTRPRPSMFLAICSSRLLQFTRNLFETNANFNANLRHSYDSSSAIFWRECIAAYICAFFLQWPPLEPLRNILQRGPLRLVIAIFLCCTAADIGHCHIYQPYIYFLKRIRTHYIWIW